LQCLDPATGLGLTGWPDFAITAKMPFNPALSAGLSGKWQSRTEKVDEYTGIPIHQDGYAPERFRALSDHRVAARRGQRQQHHR
jgi:hypothetical protein